MNLPLAIERATYVSWPAFEQIEHRGWVLRFADGCTKRANSTNVIAPLDSDLSATIDFCEAFYTNRSQPVIFRQMSFVEDTGLDAALADRAYAFIDPSLVLYQSLEPHPGPESDPVSLDRESWFQLYAEISGFNPADQVTHAKILNRVPPPLLFTVIKENDKPVACGLGAIHDGHFGIFDIVTQSDNRRRGHGTQLLRGMLAWARRNGARHAYVQVMANNPSAIRLYEKIGYRRLYQYWYRIRKHG